MSWQLLVISSNLINALLIVFIKHQFNSKKINPTTFAIGTQFVTGIIAITYILFLPNYGLPVGATFPLWNIILMTLVYGFGNVLNVVAIEKIDASKVTIIMSTSAIFTIITSGIFLKDIISTPQLIGGIIILCGIIITSLEKTKFTFGWGEALALFTAIIYGAEIVNDKVITDSIGTFPFLAIGYTLPALLIMASFAKHTKHVPSSIKRIGKINYFVYCILFFYQAVFFYLALEGAQPSSLVIINLASKIITVIISIIALKETKHLWQKFVGVIIVVIGIYLTTLT